MVNHKQRGQSIIEFIVGFAFLIPVVLFIPTLANMLSVQTQTYKAGRYAAWERTAYSGSDVKSQSTLSNEIRDRFFVNSDQGFANPKTTKPDWQQKWQDFKNKTNIVDLGNQQLGMNLTAQSPTAETRNASAWLAGKGTNAANRVQLNTMQITQVSVPISPKVSLLQAMAVPKGSWYPEHVKGADPAPPTDPVASSNGVPTDRFYIAASSALVADGWVPANEQMFHDRVAGETAGAGNALRFWENTGLTWTLGLAFREMNQHLFLASQKNVDPFDMVDPNQSTNLPYNLKKY